MKFLELDESSLQQALRSLARPGQDLNACRRAVAGIIARVRREGDRAVRALSRELDGVEPARLRVEPSALARAEGALSGPQRRSLELAIRNIRCFHRHTMRVEPQPVETVPGSTCRLLLRPLQSAGLYVPGGSAPLVSTLLMLAIPAQLAGVPRIAVCTPPGEGGLPDPAVLAACRLLGLEEIYAAGGAQAVAALAYGTETIRPVAKITGPGNIWVTAAKAEISADPEAAAIDFLAGPSELAIIADETASPRLVAADLLSQAEHDRLTRVVLITTSRALARSVGEELQRRLSDLQRRDIARSALEESFLVLASHLQQAVDLANAWAPEHLSLQTRRPQELLERITTAGSVFLGPWAPEAVGDYCSGTNHVLPTGGTARSRGGITVATYQRTMSAQTLTAAGLASLRETAVTLARLEGLEAHARAVEARFEEDL